MALGACMNDGKDNDSASGPAVARYEIRDDLPDGKLLLPIDSPHGTVMAVRKGHMSPELAEAVNRHLACMIRLGIWRHE